MNKKEKNAVESLKIKAKFIGDNYSFGTQGIINLRNELKILLNLIEKQQKELEQEKEKNEELETENFNIKQQKIIDKISIPQQENFCDYYNYIHKDKIKELLENEIINISGFRCIAVEDIEELLEMN